MNKKNNVTNTKQQKHAEREKSQVGIISIFNVLETNNIHTNIYNKGGREENQKPHNNNKEGK